MSYTPKVVRIRRKGGVVVQDCDVYIGRRMTMGGWDLPESGWHNPYSAKEYGRDKCVEMFESLMRERLLRNYGLWRNRILSLDGKTLGCWCEPEACHGDVLVKLFDEMLLDLL